MNYAHIPVMLPEVLEYLRPQSGGKFIDGTLGGAGYTMAIAKLAGPDGRVVGIDLDDLALKNAAEKITASKLTNIVLVQNNFKNLKTIAAESFPEITGFDGIVLDLGLSSAQLADESRGFSFKGERPLDMAFGPKNDRSTRKIVNEYPLLELTRIFQEYGEERSGYRIAQAIVAARRIKKLETTGDLVRVIESAVPFRAHSKIHPATRIFQALRMETNEELSVLSEALPDAVALLKTGGRLVVVSFHSGEDRIVKRFLRQADNIEILTKRPLVPSEEEVDANPRARSAKLRAAQKIR